MHPIAVFIIILIVIWSMSTAASLANKKKEQERRRRLQWQLQQTAGQSAATPRQISEGIAARFPDVLLPPAPQRRPVPSRTVKQTIQPRPIASTPPPMRKKARPTVTSQRGRGGANVMRAPTSAQPAIVQPAAASSVAPQAASAAPKMARTLAQGVAAPVIKRWLTPQILRQQFILTEVFQPPLALRKIH
jgi:hypothetical protein